MDANALVLIPPLLVLILALTTRNVILSLIISIIAAGFIAVNFDPIKAFWLIINRLLQESGVSELINLTGSYDKPFMLGFLVFLGVLIEFLSHTGSLKIITRALLKKIKTKQGAQIATLSLSFCFFIDDYLGALMVGNIMRPITDHFKIPRAKLAFLLNAVCSPLSVIVPASSWVGMILTQIEASGITKTLTSSSLILLEPFKLYLFAIPFLFYPFLSIINAWYIVLRKISFGQMHNYESIAQTQDNLFGNKEALTQRAENSSKSGSVSDIMIPLATFALVCIIALLYTGNSTLLGGKNGLFDAFIEGNNIWALFMGSFSAAIVCALSCLMKKQISLPKLITLSIDGINLMKSSLIVLWLAWALSSLLQNDLHTGEYVAHLLLSKITLFLVPTIAFIACTLTSACTGSSWGAIMFLSPLALPLMANLIGQTPLPLEYAHTLALVAAGIISGAIAGGHVSPITDSTIMASTSALSYHLDHVQTQASYSVAPLLGAIAAYILAGLLIKKSLLVAIMFPLALGIIVNILVVHIRLHLRKS